MTLATVRLSLWMIPVLPVGTLVEVLLPGAANEPTADERREWELIRQELRASEPPFPTVEEAVRYSRKRP